MKKDEKKMSIDIPKDMHLWITQKTNREDVSKGKYIRSLIYIAMEEDIKKEK
tara:strand:+ start:638 stop:793 length:156 start_codon:yes stop_codon:yes gene_type:complete